MKLQKNRASTLFVRFRSFSSPFDLDVLASPSQNVYDTTWREVRGWINSSVGSWFYQDRCAASSGEFPHVAGGAVFRDFTGRRWIEYSVELAQRGITRCPRGGSWWNVCMISCSGKWCSYIHRLILYVKHVEFCSDMDEIVHIVHTIPTLTDEFSIVRIEHSSLFFVIARRFSVNREMFRM